MTFANFDFDNMGNLMSRVRSGHEDMSALRASQFAQDVAAAESAYAGGVKYASQDARDGLNTTHVSHLAPAQTRWDDDMQTVSHRMAGAQDESVSRFFQNFNQGS
ncbi:hypothetical protein [Actinophytocola sp. NPDC049390]|uniref:hypothetical protein n=1 Tax=Actinophytocola sp. NPDC049390 TaxID=3363894 RepID=UPI0037A3E47C